MPKLRDSAINKATAAGEHSKVMLAVDHLGAVLAGARTGLRMTGRSSEQLENNLPGMSMRREATLGSVIPTLLRPSVLLC